MDRLRRGCYLTGDSPDWMETGAADVVGTPIGGRRPRRRAAPRPAAIAVADVESRLALEAGGDIWAPFIAARARVRDLPWRSRPLVERGTSWAEAPSAAMTAALARSSSAVVVQAGRLIAAVRSCHTRPQGDPSGRRRSPLKPSARRPSPDHVPTCNGAPRRDSRRRRRRLIRRIAAALVLLCIFSSLWISTIATARPTPEVRTLEPGRFPSDRAGTCPRPEPSLDARAEVGRPQPSVGADPRLPDPDRATPARRPNPKLPNTVEVEVKKAEGRRGRSRIRSSADGASAAPPAGTARPA